MSTSYTTNGAAVSTGANFGQADSDAIARGATGASAAARAQETTTDSFSFFGSSAAAGGAGASGGFLMRCGPLCWLIGGIVLLVAIDALGSSA